MKWRVAVVIPSYKVKAHILGVLAAIGPEVARIYVVDDACPEGSGSFVEQHCNDQRVKVIQLAKNSGVGGATLAGFEAALHDGFHIAVKLDGDGQMNPALIPKLILPIKNGYADYTKGNRFYNLNNLAGMPPIRLFGNSLLSFVNKAMSGYWHIMDPTNGFVAIHTQLLRLLPLTRIEKRYFFESDMLFRLNTIRAVVLDIPMAAVYGEEKSNLRISNVVLTFPRKYGTRIVKRIFYNYFLRDFNVCSLQLVAGGLLMAFSLFFGALRWYQSIASGVPAPSGTVMLAALPLILSTQFLLEAIRYDISQIPSRPLHRMIAAAGSDSSQPEDSTSGYDQRSNSSN
jgi:glycosyltransferase involved in cell wall biosynthesis